tara:strand:+ start:129 stop:233 length:105 start_codon:yes stop_codon:yes gene_type:complete
MNRPHEKIQGEQARSNPAINMHAGEEQQPTREKG